MRKLSFILAIFLLFIMAVPAQAQIAVDYPSNLRDLTLEVGEEYSFEVWIKNISTENIQITVDTIMVDLDIQTLDNFPIIEPNQRVSLPITFSIQEEGQFSKLLRISFIYTWEGTSRKGTTANIKLEGYAKGKVKEEDGMLWIYAVIAAIVGIVLYIIKRIRDWW